MEPTWGLYNNYYTGDRPPPISPHQRSEEPPSHRRSMNQGVFLPPPPPQAASQSGLPLPSVSASYASSSYHGSSPTAVGLGSTGQGSGSTSMSSGTSTAAMHMTPSMPYSSHMPVSQQMGTYSHYPMQSSPATMSALPPARQQQTHGYSPRITGGYPSASPGMTTLSPLSPSTHMGYPGTSSTSTSASSFPPSVPPPHSRVDLPPEVKKRRTNSGSGSSSWEDAMPKGKGDSSEDQPWGMPQEQYKALNPRDKKQVRNRIGARRFRAKRKNYVSQLESNKKDNENQIMRLQSQLEDSRREINDLRSRLNLPPLPPLPADSPSSLGLVVSGNS